MSKIGTATDTMHEATDADIAAMVARVDAFRETLRAAISATVVDKDSRCAQEARDGLQRIASTLDQVPVATLYNLATLDIATRGLVTSLLEATLLAVGGGPDLDFRDATSFLAAFDPIIDVARKRRIN